MSESIEVINVLYIADCAEKYGATESLIQMISGLAENNNINPILAVSVKGRLYNWAHKKGYKVIVTGHKAFLYDIGTTLVSQFKHCVFYPIRFREYRQANEKAIKKVFDFRSLNNCTLHHRNGKLAIAQTKPFFCRFSNIVCLLQ